MIEKAGIQYTYSERVGAGWNIAGAAQQGINGTGTLSSQGTQQLHAASDQGKRELREGLNEVWNGKPGFTPVTSEAPGAASGAQVAETAPVPEVERLSPDQEKVINHYATWTVTLETNRNNYVNMTGKLPDPLPINVTEAMMEGSGAYILRSHETDGYPGQRKALLDCLAGAQKDFVEAGSTVKPFNYYYASHLSQAGRDEKIFMPFAAVGDEYLRSYREGAPPQDPSKPIDIHQFE